MEEIAQSKIIEDIIRPGELLTDDFIEWSRRTQTVLKHIQTEGPKLLGQLVEQAFDNPRLRQRHEAHQLLDYLVLYEDQCSGIRLRLHIATQEHLQRMHDHRFSFSSLIINGHYQHCLYSATHDPYAMSDSDSAIRYQDRHHPDPAFNGFDAASFFHLDWIRGERKGNCYSLHHSQVHTVYTSKDTVSLVLRGPAQKNRSMIFDQMENIMWWRFSREDESEQRVSRKIMSDTKYAEVQADLVRLGVIA